MDIVPIKKIVTNVMLNMAAKKEEGIATICTTVKLPKTFLSQKGLETEKAQEKKLKQV